MAASVGAAAGTDAATSGGAAARAISERPCRLAAGWGVTLGRTRAAGCQGLHRRVCAGIGGGEVLARRSNSARASRTDGDRAPPAARGDHATAAAAWLGAGALPGRRAGPAGAAAGAGAAAAGANAAGAGALQKERPVSAAASAAAACSGAGPLLSAGPTGASTEVRAAGGCPAAGAGGAAGAPAAAARRRAAAAPPAPVRSASRAACEAAAAAATLDSCAMAAHSGAGAAAGATR